MTSKDIRLQLEFDCITEYLNDSLSEAFFNMFMDEHPDQDIDDWTMQGPIIVFEGGKDVLEWKATVHYEENVEEEVVSTLAENVFEL